MKQMSHFTHAKALALIGPTASGKTTAVLCLAEQFPIEIISMDSALVYRGMDIGTAKPTPKERQNVRHHLIDIIQPIEAYSAAAFIDDCRRLVTEIRQRGHLPVIVGGTMMYYHALTQGLSDLPRADAEIRHRLATLKQQIGQAGLYQLLQKEDPVTAKRLAPSDSQRVERALEVWWASGKPLSEHLTQGRRAPMDDFMTIALLPASRPPLHQAIAARLDAMFQAGFIDEVAALKAQYPTLTAASTAMRAVGYRQVWRYLAGDISRQILNEEALAATRQLAKRQITWLRRLSISMRIDPYADSGQQMLWQQLCQSAEALLANRLNS